MTECKADICVIGAGAAGLSVAAAAAQLKLQTVLVEQGKMGGDCLNYGCVPSKALLHAAAVIATKRAPGFGLKGSNDQIDFPAVMAHVHQAIETIAPHDSVERFTGLGVQIFKEQAQFLDPMRLAAGSAIITARRFVIATGSRPAIPKIPGLEDVPYLTNETIFDLTICPQHLLIIGAGAIGIELAQGFKRLGANVTVIDGGEMLAREDQEAVTSLRKIIQRDGITILEHHRIEEVQPCPEGISLTVAAAQGSAKIITGSHLLIATGRRPTVDGLGLDKAKVIHTTQGIQVDEYLRTSTPRIYALGDVIGGPQFTHLAAYQAGFFVRSALFGLPGRRHESAIPRCLYTEPELAQVGMTEAEARRKNISVRVVKWPLTKNDRAVTAAVTEGFAKLVADRRGRLKGVTILGPHAGEMIYAYSLAFAQGLKLSALAGAIAPYPTLAEAGRRAAGEFYVPAVFGRLARLWVRFRTYLG
ncbi:MAG: FAD-dependent oxidoreductase [Alphaproteobacteria bacterium]